jgi:hypothetical protein
MPLESEFPDYIGNRFRIRNEDGTWNRDLELEKAADRSFVEHGIQVHRTNSCDEGSPLGGQFIGELSHKFSHPTKLRSDNQGATNLAKNNKFHASSKHIDIRYHFIGDQIVKRNVIIDYLQKKSLQVSSQNSYPLHNSINSAICLVYRNYMAFRFYRYKPLSIEHWINLSSGNAYRLLAPHLRIEAETYVIGH